MSRRPLVLAFALAIGDYFLWNWSLNGNHDVLALVSGLTLPPLAAACLWLLALNIASLLANAMQRPIKRSTRPRPRPRALGRRARRRRPRPGPELDAIDDAVASSAKARSVSRKLAA